MSTLSRFAPGHASPRTRRRLAALMAGLSLAIVAASCSDDGPGSTAGRAGDERSGPPTRPADAVEFKAATLITEINATDGDAGIQIFLDHEPWKSIEVYMPDGTRLVDVVNRNEFAEYGLTELFSESSEPPFAEFPLDDFRALFPEGDYTYVGETIDGTTLHSTVTFTHDFPEGPAITSPAEDATVATADLVVRWERVTTEGVEIVGYQVVVERDEEPVRVLKVDLPADATELTVPGQFMDPGTEHKVEVVAVEKSGNQTLTEVAFVTEEDA